MVKLKEIFNNIRNDKILSIIVIFTVIIIGVLLYYNFNKSIIYEKYTPKINCDFYEKIKNNSEEYKQVSFTHSNKQKEYFIFEKDALNDFLANKIFDEIYNILSIVNSAVFVQMSNDIITILKEPPTDDRENGPYNAMANKIKNKILEKHNSTTCNGWAKTHFGIGLDLALKGENEINSTQPSTEKLKILEDILEKYLNVSGLSGEQVIGTDNSIKTAGTQTSEKLRTTTKTIQYNKCLAEIYKLFFKAHVLGKHSGNQSDRERISGFITRGSFWQRKRYMKTFSRKMLVGLFRNFVVKLFNKYSGSGYSDHLFNFPAIDNEILESNGKFITSNIYTEDTVNESDMGGESNTETKRVFENEKDDLGIYYFANDDMNLLKSYIKAYIENTSSEINIWNVGNEIVIENIEKFKLNASLFPNVDNNEPPIYAYIKEELLRDSKLKTKTYRYAGYDYKLCKTLKDLKCPDNVSWCWPHLPISGKSYNVVTKYGQYWVDPGSEFFGLIADANADKERKVAHIKFNKISIYKGKTYNEESLYPGRAGMEKFRRGHYSIRGGFKDKNCATEGRGRGIICNRPWVGPWERYTIEPYVYRKGYYAIKSLKNGKFLEVTKHYNRKTRKWEYRILATGRPPSEFDSKLYNKIFKFEEANELPKNVVSKPVCESKWGNSFDIKYCGEATDENSCKKLVNFITKGRVCNWKGPSSPKAIITGKCKSKIRNTVNNKICHDHFKSNESGCNNSPFCMWVKNDTLKRRRRRSPFRRRRRSPFRRSPFRRRRR